MKYHTLKPVAHYGIIFPKGTPIVIMENCTHGLRYDGGQLIVMRPRGMKPPIPGTLCAINRGNEAFPESIR